MVKDHGQTTGLFIARQLSVVRRQWSLILGHSPCVIWPSFVVARPSRLITRQCPIVPFPHCPRPIAC